GAQAEERQERVETHVPRRRPTLVERSAHDRPGWTIEEADTVVLSGDEPPHLRVGLLGRTIAPRLLVAVGLEGTVEELSGFVKATVVISVGGGAEMNERADVIFDGDEGELLSALE